MSTLNVAFGPQITTAAERHGVDPTLLAAVAAQETGGPGATSGRNIVGDGGHGHGLFQIDDRWHAFARTAAASDPAANADYAASLIGGLLKKFMGDVHKALSAFNSGSPNAVGTRTDWGDGKPIGYADSVERHYSLLRGSPPTVALTPNNGCNDIPQQFRNALFNPSQPLPLAVEPNESGHRHCGSATASSTTTVPSTAGTTSSSAGVSAQFDPSLDMSSGSAPVVPQPKQHAQAAQSADHFLTSSFAADDDA